MRYWGLPKGLLLQLSMMIVARRVRRLLAQRHLTIDLIHVHHPKPHHVAGVLLGFGMMFPNRIVMPLFPPIPMKARTFVIVFGTIELVLGMAGRSGVAHFAHLGGMLGGWLMIRYWRGQPPFGPSRRR